MNSATVKEQPVIGITMGDPAGIGPEIIVKALADPDIRKAAKFIIFGMHEQLCYAADRAEIEPFWGLIPHEKLTRDMRTKVVVAEYDEFSLPAWINEPNLVSGESSLAFCQDAILAAQDQLIDGIVTAPISKVSWHLAGAQWPGHTELFAAKWQIQTKGHDVREWALEDRSGHDSRCPVRRAPQIHDRLCIRTH